MPGQIFALIVSVMHLWGAAAHAGVSQSLMFISHMAIGLVNR